MSEKVYVQIKVWYVELYILYILYSNEKWSFVLKIVRQIIYFINIDSSQLDNG